MPARNALTLGSDRALYVGEIPATGWHRHASPVLLMGLSGRFAVHWGVGRTETCHSALVDAGVEHLFDPRGEAVALVYLEPDSREARGLRGLLLQEGGVVLDVATPVRTRSAVESYLRHFDLPALLRCPLERDLAPMDPRVLQSLRVLRTPMAGRPARDVLASGVQLPRRVSTTFFAPKWA